MNHDTKYSMKPKSSTTAIAVKEQVVSSSTIYWFVAGFIALLIASFLTAFPAKAQVYDTRDYQRQSHAYVTVYEDCDFRGKSREISVGDYQNIRDLGLGNDKLSSMRVPRGLELELYEDERFRGESATINRDVSCLDRRWNDKASSLRVVYDERDRGRYDSRDRYDDRDNGRYDSRNRNNDDRYNDYDRRDRNDNRRPGVGSSVRDLTKNVDRVEFANTTLVKGNRNRWSMQRNSGRNQSFKELDRDNNVIYLRNSRTRELLELDLYSSMARVISTNGRQTDYRINRVFKDSGRSARVPPREPTITPNPTKGNAFGVVNGSCFNYKAYARGGRGGIKFDAKGIKQQFDDDAVSGRVCHSGSLTMELNKMDPNVDVFVEIQGRTYKFSRGEKEDLLLNTWYRKMVKLKVTG